jgi:hypothetical protein
LDDACNGLTAALFREQKFQQNAPGWNNRAHGTWLTEVACKLAREAKSWRKFGAHVAVI